MVLAAALGLVTFAAGWVYAVDQKAVGSVSQARADHRPPASDRAARDAHRDAPRDTPATRPGTSSRA